MLVKVYKPPDTKTVAKNLESSNLKNKSNDSSNFSGVLSSQNIRTLQNK